MELMSAATFQEQNILLFTALLTVIVTGFAITPSLRKDRKSVLLCRICSANSADPNDPGVVWIRSVFRTGSFHQIRNSAVNSKHISLLWIFVMSAFLVGCNVNIAVNKEDAPSMPSDNNEVSDQPLRRLDDDGYLYYMDYTGDYYGPDVIDSLRRIGYVDSGCSNFFTHNTEGEPVTCRNYDYPHRISSEDRTLTGLNIVLHCKPEGKYESIAISDAVWCDENSPYLQKGGPDLAGFEPGMLDILPYQCMDGINEKGLCVSVLRVDIKEGDQPCRLPVGSSMLLRYMLDDCANIDEAVKKTKTSILVPEDWQNCHFFVTDATGRSAVIESRNSSVSVIESDVCTNFYLASDDMEDYYRNDKLGEEAVKMTDEDTTPDYHYGYGHGYHRFVTILGQLERYRDTAREDYFTLMPESSALVILQSAVQNPYTNASGISMTQYSVIYNNAQRTLEVWSFQDYSKSFKFDVKGSQLNN